MPTIQDFAALALKVGTIREVADHPDANRLFVLRVDLGTEVRTLVAGLKGRRTAEELMGRQIVVATGLEPAKLRGVESQGMLLAVTDGDRVALVSPEWAVPPGASVQ